MVLSTAMLLQHFGMLEEAKAVGRTVSICIDEGFLTTDLNETNAKSCSEVGSYLSAMLTNKSIA